MVLPSLPVATNSQREPVAHRGEWCRLFHDAFFGRKIRDRLTKRSAASASLSRWAGSSTHSPVWLTKILMIFVFTDSMAMSV